MKALKWLLIFIVILIGALLAVMYSFQVKVEESELPINVYEQDADLLSVMNDRMVSLVLPSSNEYTIIEEVLNLVVLNSIRENVNPDYDPLGDCETTECNFIIHEDFYYINYIFVELTDDNQFLIKVSLGSDKILEYNTVFSFLFDVEIDYLGFDILLTLNKYQLADTELSISILDKIFDRIDAENIESQVSTGVLDLEEHSYTISFSPFS